MPRKRKQDVNAAGTEIRGTMVDFLKKNFKKVICDFDCLPAKERVRVYCELFRHAVPRLKMLDNKIDLIELSTEQIAELMQQALNR